MKYKNKKIKYNAKSCIITAVLLLAIIIINIFAGSLNITLDSTKEKLYSISKESKTVLSNIDKDVNIYALYEKGNEDPVIQQLFNKYENASNKIKCEFKDPYTDSDFTLNYSENGEDFPVGTIIIDCESTGRYRVVTQDKMASYSVDQYTNMSYMTSFNAESCITEGISYVTSDSSTMIYNIKGHSEMDIDENLVIELQNQNYEVESLTLDEQTAIPEDASILMINSPMTDISSSELQKISEFVANNGKIIINIGISTENLVNIGTLLSNYGVSANNAIVIEGSTDNMYQNTPFYVLPNIEEHTITENINKEEQTVFFPYAQGFDVLDTKRESVTVEPLLTTSSSSYAKKELTDIYSYEKTDNDIMGPFNIAVAVTDEYNANKSKMIVFGGSAIMDSNIDSYANGGNYDFIIGSVNWLMDKENNISIPNKAINGNEYLQLSGAQALSIMFVSVILIPVVIIVIGIYVVIKRKRK